MPVPLMNASSSALASSLAELLQNVVFQIECVIVEQLLGHLYSNMELVGIQDDLVEGSVTESQCAALLDPRSRRLGWLRC